MELRFGPKGMLMIDDARITFKNFSGKKGPYNKDGEREFSLVIPNEDIKEQLLNDVNEDGASWNVRVKPPRDPQEDPLIYLKVKVRFNQYGPKVYVISNGVQELLDEEDVGMIDRIAIEKCDMDISPSDKVVNGKPYRTAYLRAIRVYQRETHYDRFAERNDEPPF